MASFIFASSSKSAISIPAFLNLAPLPPIAGEVSWKAGTGFIVTAFGGTVALDALGHASGTAVDIRIADATGKILLLIRDANVPLASLADGFSTAGLNGGSDSYLGGAASETIEAGAGDDKVYGKAGNDFIDGGAGNDQLSGGDGCDTICGGNGDDDIYGGNGDDLARGGAGDDLVCGNAGVDTLDGGDGNDRLAGGDGGDKMYGGNGCDVLTGGAGKDYLFGNSGRDVFKFDSIHDTGCNAAKRDVIVDFEKKTDKIDLCGIDANECVDGNQSFKFIWGNDFSGYGGEVRYRYVDAYGTANDRTIVEGDVNGDKKADFQIELCGLKCLTNYDFVL
ncbi:MAG: calcium-binding protein [Hyphomicrobium sp.]|nr:calcium-binding protein [Hyphomicrobium sp.]